MGPRGGPDARNTGAGGLNLTLGIVAHNQPHLTRLAVTSALATTQGAKTILWDNGSDDISVRPMHEEFLEYGVTVVESHRNVGWIGAVNSLARMTETTYFVAANNDVEFLPGWWGPLQDALETPGIVLAGYAGKHSRLDAEFNAVHAQPGDKPDYLEGYMIAMPTWAAQRFGPFDAGNMLNIYYDDVDLCWRIREAGYQFHVIPGDPRVKHRGNGTLNSPAGAAMIAARDQNRAYMRRRWANRPI